jgi:hypothetical protein
MRFSEHFAITRKKSETWFDPVLSIDTPLFIDPFLIYDNEKSVFRGSHSEIARFFKSIFTLIAKSGGEKYSNRYLKAITDLVFPEIEELCLGYTAAGTGGLGSGKELGSIMASAIWDAIQAGMVHIDHFEEVAILRENIGPDRISDITGNLLRHRLARYTQQICRRYGIPVTRFKYVHARYDVNKRRWIAGTFDLPINPYNRKAILLVPEFYLKDLPTINAADFWDYCVSFHSSDLRRELNFDITRNLPKKQIVEIARRHADLRNAYIDYRESRRSRPYNLTTDKKGYVKWYDASKSYVDSNPVQFAIQDSRSFLEAVAMMVEEFRHFVEQNAGYRLLWNDNGKNKSEKAAQLLFLGIVKHYCQANNIEISPEPNIGRGPVDFKVSIGHGLRALLELKLARNGKFWNNARKQLPTYLKAERVKDGFFIVIVFTDNDTKRVRGIKSTVTMAAKAANCKIRTVTVDASTDKPSASKM